MGRVGRGSAGSWAQSWAPWGPRGWLPACLRDGRGGLSRVPLSTPQLPRQAAGQGGFRPFPGPSEAVCTTTWGPGVTWWTPFPWTPAVKLVLSECTRDVCPWGVAGRCPLPQASEPRGRTGRDSVVLSSQPGERRPSAASPGPEGLARGKLQLCPGLPLAAQQGRDPVTPVLPRGTRWCEGTRVPVNRRVLSIGSSAWVPQRPLGTSWGCGWGPLGLQSQAPPSLQASCDGWGSLEDLGPVHPGALGGVCAPQLGGVRGVLSESGQRSSPSPPRLADPPLLCDPVLVLPRPAELVGAVPAAVPSSPACDKQDGVRARVQLCASSLCGPSPTVRGSDRGRGSAAGAQG